MLSNRTPEEIAHAFRLGMQEMEKNKTRWCLPLNHERWQVTILILGLIIDASIVLIGGYAVWKLATLIL
jgi:hypothetical protein